MDTPNKDKAAATKLEAALTAIEDMATLLADLPNDLSYLTNSDLPDTEKINELDRRLRDASSLLHAMRDRLYVAKAFKRKTPEIPTDCARAS